MSRSFGTFQIMLATLYLSACTGSKPPPSDTDTGETDPDPLWTDGAHSCNADKYLPFSVRGWTVCADVEIFDDATHGDAVLTLLSADLEIIQNTLPEVAVDYLQGVRIWIELTSDWLGAVYHPSTTWLADNGYPTYWGESIQLANSANYLSWTSIQPAMVLHELSHAWHHQVVGYSDADIADAYAQALASGRYESVAYAGGGTAEAYATTDDREYFAELSEAWFWENDFYPFVREDVIEFDPLGAEVIEASWARTVE